MGKSALGVGWDKSQFDLKCGKSYRQPANGVRVAVCLSVEKVQTGNTDLAAQAKPSGECVTTSSAGGGGAWGSLVCSDCQYLLCKHSSWPVSSTHYKISLPHRYNRCK